MIRVYFLASYFLLLPFVLLAQKTKSPLPADTAGKGIKAPTAQQPTRPKTGSRNYKEVITDKAITQKGLFTVHKIDDKFFFEIADSILGRDILIVSSLSKAGADMRNGGNPKVYGGDQLHSNIVRFEKGPNNKIFMRDISYGEYAKDSTMPMYRAVMNSNIQPIALSFDIRTTHVDSTSGATSSVIEMTDVINSDNDIFFARFGAYQPDKSYPVEVKTYPVNTEISVVKTYATPPNPGRANGGLVTVELKASMVLLPKVPMQPRYADQRVGYYTSEYVDFNTDPQGVKRTSMIARWRLEPREQDLEKYKNGKLVEPKDPIVIYIDPATPEKWIPYLIQGINDWQVAFEQAGFKNAIFGKRAPSPREDSTWSLDDARHSALVYKPSIMPKASGPHTSDPRSGEIMETHINWYHNVMSLLRNWYMIQAGAVDPKARKMELDDSLMGQLIRFASSHEIGHTLGLAHNFGSSSTVPVEKLRNKKWVEAHGHTPSIMDYARFNYVAQPEDNINEKGIFPRIGDYDKWAIEWGYRLFTDIKDPKEETTMLNKWIIESLSKNPRLWFGPQSPSGIIDPRSQDEDLGDNAVLAGQYGIKNLKRILVQLPDWTRIPNEGYHNLKVIYGELLKQYSRYAGHVLNNVGGMYINTKSIEEKGDPYTMVPKARQQEAVTFLNEQVFKTPTWLFNKDIAAKIDPSLADVNKTGMSVIASLLSINRLSMLLINSRSFGNANTYTCKELLEDVRKSIWTELHTHRPIDNYRRDVQNVYLDNLIKIVTTPLSAPMAELVEVQSTLPVTMPGIQSDLIALVRTHLLILNREINAAIPGTTDGVSKDHLRYAAEKINRAFDPKSKTL